MSFPCSDTAEHPLPLARSSTVGVRGAPLVRVWVARNRRCDHAGRQDAGSDPGGSEARWPRSKARHVSRLACCR
ncbi:hypothetical protein [Kibdelosporangium philippinense]|uniref:hypothetical protein n=1 Tax=Kibdelosporangium philippinense TaxID=211113 RepID=UPI00360EB68D